MSQCEHKTEAEYGICNRCTAFARIAKDAKAMLDARKAYLNQLLVDAKASDPAQYELSDRVKRLEQSVQFATDANLWAEEPVVSKPEKPEEVFPPKSCNRHQNCAEAKAKFISENGREPGVNFHCWSEDCEDCFGK